MNDAFDVFKATLVLVSRIEDLTERVENLEMILNGKDKKGEKQEGENRWEQN